MQFGWTKVYYDPETAEIVHKRIPDAEVYVGVDTGPDGYTAETTMHVQPDGRLRVTDVKTWRHEIDLVANRDAGK